MTTANEMVEFFAAADAANAVPVSTGEKDRCAELTKTARSAGLSGAARLEWMRLVQRGGQR